MTVLEQLEKDASEGNCKTQRFCSEVAKLFKVRAHEVAVMDLRESMLHFVYPPELRSTGTIPLISSAQAAKTCNTKRAEIFNKFSNVRHSSIFETIKVASGDPMTIQKLMSAPILSADGATIGVIQVSRKGFSLHEAGPDFAPADLQLLQDVAKVYGRIVRSLQAADSGIVPDGPNPALVAGLPADAR